MGNACHPFVEACKSGSMDDVISLLASEELKSTLPDSDLFKRALTQASIHDRLNVVEYLIKSKKITRLWFSGSPTVTWVYRDDFKDKWHIYELERGDPTQLGPLFCCLFRSYDRNESSVLNYLLGCPMPYKEKELCIYRFMEVYAKHGYYESSYYIDRMVAYHQGTRVHILQRLAAQLKQESYVFGKIFNICIEYSPGCGLHMMRLITEGLKLSSRVFSSVNLSELSITEIRTGERIYDFVQDCIKREKYFLEFLLSIPDIDPNKKDDRGLTILHRSVLYNRPDLVESILKNKSVDVNALNNNFDSPFYLAYRSDRRDIMQLIRKDHRMDEKLLCSFLSLSKKDKSFIVDIDRDLLYTACRDNRGILIEFLLNNPSVPLKRLLDYTTQKGEEDFMSVVIRNNHVNVMRMLLDNCSDQVLRETMLHEALITACHCLNSDIVRFILSGKRPSMRQPSFPIIKKRARHSNKEKVMHKITCMVLQYKEENKDRRELANIARLVFGAYGVKVMWRLSVECTRFVIEMVAEQLTGLEPLTHWMDVARYPFIMPFLKRLTSNANKKHIGLYSLNDRIVSMGPENAVEYTRSGGQWVPKLRKFGFDKLDDTNLIVFKPLLEFVNPLLLESIQDIRLIEWVESIESGITQRLVDHFVYSGKPPSMKKFTECIAVLILLNEDIDKCSIFGARCFQTIEARMQSLNHKDTESFEPMPIEYSFLSLLGRLLDLLWKCSEYAKKKKASRFIYNYIIDQIVWQAKTKNLTQLLSHPPILAHTTPNQARLYMLTGEPCLKIGLSTQLPSGSLCDLYNSPIGSDSKLYIRGDSSPYTIHTHKTIIKSSIPHFPDFVFDNPEQEFDHSILGIIKLCYCVEMKDCRSLIDEFVF